MEEIKIYKMILQKKNLKTFPIKKMKMLENQIKKNLVPKMKKDLKIVMMTMMTTTIMKIREMEKNFSKKRKMILILIMMEFLKQNGKKIFFKIFQVNLQKI